MNRAHTHSGRVGVPPAGSRVPRDPAIVAAACLGIGAPHTPEVSGETPDTAGGTPTLPGNPRGCEMAHRVFLTRN